MEFTWLFLAVALGLPLVFFLLPRGPNGGKNRRRLPPGPADPPVLGNLLWWIPSDDGMYNLRAQRRLHTIYGPLLAVRKGSRLDVTISDRHLAYTALVSRGAALADRPDYAVRDFGGLNATTITSSNYGPLWRLLRRNFVAEVVHPDRVALFAPARAAVLSDLTGRLRRQQEEHGGDDGVGNVAELFQYAMFRLVLTMCFGELLGEAAVRDIESTLRELMIHSMAKLDVFAVLPAITTRLFRGRLTAMHDMRRRLSELYLPLIAARRARKKHLGAGGVPPEKETTLPHSYVDTLLDMRLGCDGGRALTDHEINAMCSELLIQGTDTTVTALEWTMAELVKNPSIQEKLHEEIIRSISIGDSRLLDNKTHVSEQDLKKMPYLRAVVLEGLRRHPPGPLLVVHAAAEDTELNGYVIPKGSPVNVMAVDIAMDAETWGRPTEFVPERFMPGGDGEGVDVTCAREIKMLPFGAGRRVCPAIGVATLHLEYLVANLVSTFEWREVETDKVDVTAEKAEFAVVMKKTLRARLVPRRHV